MPLFRNYSPELYPKYDNYDAINVDRTVDIPCDYYGVMGVPITFLSQYNPDQFEIVAFRKGTDGKDLVYSFPDCSHSVNVERERELTRTKAIKWLELQDVLKIKNGKDYKSFNAGNYPVYGSGGIMAYVDTFTYDKPSVLIPRKGSIDKLYYVDVPFWNVDTIFYTDINNEIVLTKYVYYWLQKEHLEKLNTAGGVPSLTQTVLNKVKIAVPPLEEQERIVSILDRFDKLCNDISEGLPAEIEARQKQYEYYRDKLLMFKRVEANEK